MHSLLLRKRSLALTLSSISVCLVLAASGAHSREAPSTSLSGDWAAAVDVAAMHVPFRFGISARGAQVTGWFYNGDERVISAPGSFQDNRLTLDFPTYARRLEATVNPDGTLEGRYLPTTPGSKSLTYSFHAHRADAHDQHAGPVPSIAGSWLIVTPSSEKANERAWRFLVHQSGAKVSAAILRVDGDSGALTGTWQDGKLLLSHFDGARPSVLEITPGPENTLQLLVRDTHGADVTLTAYRAADAQAKGLPQPADPTQHTRVRDPSEPFQFSFPDLDGRLVANTDERFRGKVIVVDIGGSWCPNCHDEAPLLQKLYDKYHSRGLEIVTLSFEEPEQLVNPFRLRAFVKDFHLTYTVLIAGSTQELHAKVPQAVDLDAYPTTFFIGRDGRVRSVHAGFAARVTGEFNKRLQEDFTRQIEQLLAEKPAAG